MKSAALYIGFGLAVVLFLMIVSSRHEVPAIPDDPFHQGITNHAACTTCHTPGRQAPLKASHPPKDECLLCHQVRQSGR